MPKKKNPILKHLPLHIRKKNSKWYIDTKLGTLIHNSQIHKHIPLAKEELELKDEIIRQARWDLKQD